ncbi:hypothetical protein AWN90_40215 [Nocardia terpenica]|uniref:Uncharacterized protein n=1 Tax=Nocardia terpenica TaxID=455432 RepID=A0A164JWA3_9NOCA|nr:hypothetical protein AWN90_40215 [Nocardia terpenica]
MASQRRSLHRPGGIAQLGEDGAHAVRQLGMIEESEVFRQLTQADRSNKVGSRDAAYVSDSALTH